MSSSTSSYSFDGTCELSKNADFTLTFDDESFLKIQKCLLELASPVFKTAIGECDNSGTLHLTETSRDAWILILNYIHPAGRSDSYAENVVSEGLPTLGDVLRQCEKYWLVPLQQDLDRRIANCMYALANGILCKRDSSSSASHRFTYLIVDANLELFQAVRVFHLPQSEEAMASYLISVLEENNSRINEQRIINIPISQHKLKDAISPITQLLAQMIASGRYRMCALLVQKMMDAQLCFSVDIPNVGGMAGRFG